MKNFALVMMLFTQVAFADFSECLPLNAISPNDPAMICIQHYGRYPGLAKSVEVFSSSHALLDSITFRELELSGSTARSLTQQGFGRFFSVSVEQFSGQESWLTQEVFVTSLKNNRAQSYPNRTNHDGGATGSHCLPGRPSHC